MKIDKNINLSKYTTFKIGGVAEFFSEAQTKQNLLDAIEYANKNSIPLNIIGGGSNILISDKGIEGLSVINKYKEINIEGKLEEDINIENNKSFYNEGEYFKFSDLIDTNERDTQKYLVRVSSGVNLTYLINETLHQNLTGIQYFSGIPGTLGGAIFNNIHGGEKLIGDLVYSATLIDKKGEIINVNNNFFEFGYDDSILHKNEYILIDAQLILFEGNVEKAKETAHEWIKRKRNIQPSLPSAGSIFKNITNEEKDVIQAPVNSAGWLIENAGLKGKTIGGAQVYQKHANYIVNIGFAKASDVTNLIEVIQEEVFKKFKIELIPEIILKGDF